MRSQQNSSNRIATAILTLALPLVVALSSGLGAPASAWAQSPQQPADAILAPLSDGAQLTFGPLDPSVPTPAAILGYPIGARFSQQHQVLHYLEQLAEASERVQMWRYGETYEGRPLTLLAISSPDNLRDLERIRRDQLRLATPASLDGQEQRRLLDQAPAIVWLGYGVHGNESSSTEAALLTAYLLAASGGDIERHLEDTVVLLDPLLNPDGRERYVNSYLQRRGARPDGDSDSYEHYEPWPGGRFNHYLFDLNRDWAWATQLETRHRLKAYQQWEPQVFVDLHEMGSDSSYFFPPSADPIHQLMDDDLPRWLDAFGRGNAEAFERQGWIYFKAEYFDLFYPAYGDSYPGLRQAVGMTYEMAGGGRAGQLIERSDGSTLTLADRAARHTTSSLATIATAAEQRRPLLESYVAGRRRLPAERTYVWSADLPEATALARLFELHGVEVRQLDEEVEIQGQLLGANGPSSQEAQEADDTEGSEPHTFTSAYAVNTAQPLGDLVEALLQREATLSPDFVERQNERRDLSLDLEFYDITAWSLPLAYGIDTWSLPGKPPWWNRTRQLEDTVGTPLPAPDRALAYLLPPQGLVSYQWGAELLRTGVRARLALLPFRLEGRDYPAGTLIVLQRGNADDLGGRLQESAERLGARFHAVTTGYTESGPALGSENNVPLSPARIGLLAGSGVSPTGHGSLWHLLDRQVDVAHSRIDVETLGSIDLEAFDVLILPSGFYGGLGEGTAERLRGWLQRGGLLIAIGNAQSWLATQELTEVATLASQGESDGDAKSAATPSSIVPDMELSMYTPGAVVASTLSWEHPLGVGLDSSPAILVQGDRVLLPSGDPRRDVLRVRDLAPLLAGFTWPEAIDRLAGSLLMGVERVGSGRIVLFAQDPTFRGFWRASMPLLLNSAIYGPSLIEAGKI